MKPIYILAADDDPNSNQLLQMAFQQAAPDLVIDFVSNGKEAIDYLQHKPPFDRRESHAALLLLDIKMPVMDGFQVLEWLGKFPKLRPDFIVIFSTSDHPEDCARAWVLGADGYLVKPIHYSKLLEQVGALARLVRTGFMPPDPARIDLRLKQSPR